MNQMLKKAKCPNCRADNSPSSRSCWKCGQLMPQFGAQQMVSPASRPTQSPFAGVLDRQIVGRPLVLTMLLGLYCVPSAICFVGCVLAILGGPMGLLVGGIGAVIYGGVLYTGYNLWNGVSWARTVLMILLALQIVVSGYKLYSIYAGSDLFGALFMALTSSPAHEWFVLALCTALLIYLNTPQAKEYCE